MSRARRALAATAAAAVVSPVLAACSGAAGDLDSGALVVYSGRQEALVKPLFEQFTAATGIRVSVRYGDSAELSAQLLEEGDRTEADLFLSQDAGALGALGKRGRLDVLPAEVLDKVPPAYRADDGRWVGVTGRARVIAYNPVKVRSAELPERIEDVADPEWKDEVGIAPTNASFQAFVTAMRVLRGDEATRSFLRRLKDNGARIYPNNVAILEAVDDGEISLGLINHYYWFERVAELGRGAVTARLHYLRSGDAGALVNVSGAGLLTGADKPAEARRLLDYLLGADGQRYFTEKEFEYPVVAGVATPAELPKLETLRAPAIDLSDLDTLDETLRMLDEVGLT